MMRECYSFEFRKAGLVLILVSCLNHVMLSGAFLIMQKSHKYHLVGLEMARYGPSDKMMPMNDDNMDGDFFEDFEEWEKKDAKRVSKLRKEFHELIQKLVEEEDEENNWPGIMARHVDFIVNLKGYEGVSFMKEALDQAESNGFTVDQVSDAINYIVSFMEDFVGEAKSIDDIHKELLGKIIRTITNLNQNNKSEEATAEEVLDQVLEEEKENFSPGFLRHLEGECQRIASAPSMSRESAKLLEIIQLIQTRVVEELGRDLGEGALVLGQLLGYDDPTERLAVLDAGLTVRGIDFAEELYSLTQEALEGFQKIASTQQVDPNLINMVSGIDQRIKSFLDKNKNNESPFQ